MVSPLPPAWSGIADYTRRLLPRLSDDWEISVVVADDDPEPATLPDDVRVFTFHEWPWAHRLVGAERMLLCLGNSHHHLHVPELCRRHGGVVLAHDVRATAFHCLRAAASSDPHFLSRLVGERHGPEMEREIRELEEQSSVAESFDEVRRRLEEVNALLLGAATAGAHAVLVHTRLAARLARLELTDTGVPVSVVPFGHPALRVAPREPVTGRICSFGMVEPEKNPMLLIEALPAMRAALPNATLRFVGPIGKGMAGPLERLADRLGVSEAVSMTDRVGDAEYQDELDRAEVAVQLRAVVNGEASAAVADCLSAGIPTVVSAIGAQAELPAGAAVGVRPGARAPEIVTSLLSLLTDDSKRKELSRGAAEHAGRYSFATAARALTGALRSAPPLRD